MMVKVSKEGGRCNWCLAHIPQLLTFCVYQADFQLLAPVILCLRQVRISRELIQPSTNNLMGLVEKYFSSLTSQAG